MVFQLQEKNPQKNFFFCKKIFFREKKKFRVTIFRKQNGGWTHLRKKNKIFLEENGDQVLLRKENKKNGGWTPLVRKEDKKGGNEPQTNILNLLTDKIGLHWYDRQFECDSESETDLKFGLHIYDLNLPIEAQLLSRSSAI